MASGFITLGDGRTFGIRWTGDDLLLGLVVGTLGEAADERALRLFLRELVPSPEQPADYEMGWGFVRAVDAEAVVRILDLRELTPHNQHLFWQALQRAFRTICMGQPHEGTAMFLELVQDLLRARRLVARRQPWSAQTPKSVTGNRIGPGWPEEDA